MENGVIVIHHNWQTIRERPAMFLTPVCVCALRHLVRGYEMGLAGRDSPSPFHLPRDFSDWVAYRLHFDGSSSGWANMLIERLGDGRHAFDRFFALFDEYHTRVPRVVATVSGFHKTYTQYYGGEVKTVSYPSDFTLTAYNSEDPGLFVSAEGHSDFPGMGFCPSLHSFEASIGRCSNLTVIDQAAIDRWSAADPEDEAQDEPDPA
jgi:hypothetical protein